VLYGITTARLSQQVNRNLTRFPPDFIFQLPAVEFANLMLQFATSSSAAASYGGLRKPTRFSSLRSRVAINATCRKSAWL
jgi:hypothetical protein